MFSHRFGKLHAPEFPQGLTWLNSTPLSLRSLRGKVVLVDFWTYSCVNCIRTLPHLKRWHETYKDKNVVIIGVHTPEFDFEKDEANVRAAMVRYGIPYPVVLDPDYAIWKLYANRWWPRSFLVNHQGNIVYDHVGEGGYTETEMAIQQALLEAGIKDLPPVLPIEATGGGICYRTTPEIYLGYVRGRYANKEAIEGHAEFAYTDNKERTPEDVPVLHGHWQIEQEFAEHARDLPIYTEYLGLKYSAFSVNLVMESTARAKSMVKVDLDGKPIPKDMAGKDIMYDDEHNSIVEISEPRMYNLVNADTYHRGNLTVRVKDKGVRLFAFTFGGCKENWTGEKK